MTTTPQKTSAVIAAMATIATIVATATTITAFLTAPVSAQVTQNPPIPTEAAKGSVNQINWLAGCWQGTSSRDGATINEMWFAPRGGSAMGVGATYTDDKTSSSEAMRMYDEGDSIKFWVRPAGRAEATMTLDNMGDKFVSFSAKANELTTRLRYERKSESEMLASLRFEQGATRRGADFVFNRVDCAGFFLPLANASAKDAEKK